MGLICYVEFAEPLGHFITLSGVRRDAELVFSPLWNDFVQGLIKWPEEKSEIVSPKRHHWSWVVFDVQIYGTAQDEKTTFKQKNAASTGMKE